jgi:hypothetical protein
LHLIHRDAGQVEDEWRKSARGKLEGRFRRVVERNEALAQLEVDETGKVNAAAFQKWQDVTSPGQKLEDKVQVLDEVVTSVWNLGESGGKYTRIIRKFEKWLNKRRDTLESREHDDLGDDVMFLEELDSSWKDDCRVLGRKLEAWRDLLKDLENFGSGSSLATTVEGCRRLIEGMLVELDIIGLIERDAMCMEVEWIKSANHDTDEDSDIPTAGAIWRLQ